MKVQPEKIVQYGKNGFSALQTGRRLFSLARATPFHYKRKARKAVKKQEHKEKWQQKRKEWHRVGGIFGKRLTLVLPLVVAVKRRYF